MAIVLIVLVVLIAGGGGYYYYLSQVAPAQRQTRILRIGLTHLTLSFDPAIGNEVTTYTVLHLVYDTLVTNKGGDVSNVVPDLAQSWQVSPDGTTWTFKLDPRAKFANGAQVTAQDVAYSFNRIFKIKLNPAAILGVAMDASSTTALDASTVQIKLAKPFGPLLSLLTVAYVVNAAVVQAHDVSGDLGQKWLGEQSGGAGSGPYILDHWTRDVEFTLVKNTNFWGGIYQQPPAFDQIVFPNLKEPTTSELELEKGDIDVALNLTPDVAANISPSSGVKTLDVTLQTVVFIGMNVKNGPFKDARVRQAVMYGIDRQGIINQLVKGKAIPAGPIPNGMTGYDPSQVQTYDVGRAKSLLAAAGYANGLTVGIISRPGAYVGVNWDDIAAKVQSDLAKIGITVNIQSQAPATFLQNYRAGKFDMVLASWSPDYPDGSNFAWTFMDNSGPVMQRTGYVDNQTTPLVQAGFVAVDPNQRAKLFQQAATINVVSGEDAYLFQPQIVLGYRQNIAGITGNPVWLVDLLQTVKS
jgi:peptide/nickel transport system substrate-binding protein